MLWHCHKGRSQRKKTGRFQYLSIVNASSVHPSVTEGIYFIVFFREDVMYFMETHEGISWSYKVMLLRAVAEAAQLLYFCECSRTFSHE